MSILNIADLFCGAGGTSTGAIQAATRLGYTPRLTAVNHWDVAVATHTANHPDALHRHLCASVDSLNPRHLYPDGRLDILWASPECTHHSRARGGKPMQDQSRATAWLKGVAARSSDPQFPDVPEWVGYDMAATAAFEAGLAGDPEPRWVLAVRIGPIPEGGRSYNFADQRFERGVSVLHVVGESRSDNRTYDLFNGGELRYVAGWIVGVGSDNEPVLAGCIDLERLAR